MFYGKYNFIHQSFLNLVLLVSAFAVGLGISGCTTAAPPATSSPVSIPPVTITPVTSDPVTETGQMLPITATAQLAGKTFHLEVAQTPDQQAMGLMYRPALPDDRGMLFPITVPRPVTFWMRNVPVALDMVFMHKGRIVAIASSVPPCTTPSCPTYGPQSTVDHVLELRSGRASELGIKVGDPIAIETLK